MIKLRPHRLLVGFMQVSIGVFFVVLTGVLLSLRGPILDCLAEVQATLTEAKIAAFHAQAAAKALKQEFGDPAAIAERNRVTKSTNALLATYTRSGEYLNTELMPSAGAILGEIQETSRAFTETVKQTQAVLAVNGGHVSEILVELNQAAKNLRQLTESPELLALLPALRQVIENANATTGEIQAMARSFSQTAGHGDALATEAEKLIVEARTTLQTSQRTLDAGTKTLGTLRKVAWGNLLVGLGGLLIK